MEKIEKLLAKKDVQVLKKYLEECQLQYYMSNDDVIYKDFLFGITNYDVLCNAIGLDEQNDMLLNDMIDRGNFLDVLTIFKTNVSNLYFVRMEQYGYADEDAVVYRLAFTKDENSILDDCKTYMKNKDFIKNRKIEYGKENNKRNSYKCK